MAVITEINPYTYKGKIPIGADLVCYEKGTDPLEGMICYGFDEVGDFDHYFKKPAYAFIIQD